MEIEDSGPNPERLAAAIHLQVRHASGPVPIYEIAEALDIVEIREAPMRGLEGAVVTTPDRNVGSIVVNSRSHPVRRRFTLAHELGHFLNPWHRPSDRSGGFSCTRADLGNGWRRRASAHVSRHVAQEIEANRFAIELLAPTRLLRPYLSGIPDLAKVIELADDLGLSREAGAALCRASSRTDRAGVQRRRRRALRPASLRFSVRELPAWPTLARSTCRD
jgi:Zn-dependent peptidase ImmA (M78 family)